MGLWVRIKVPAESAAGKGTAACGNNTAFLPEDLLRVRFASYLHDEIFLAQYIYVKQLQPLDQGAT
jgi:hypothetical protein